ncbi:MAG: helix-turn-helix domain-containing protein [Chloroflexi bacterium]|uniref:Helix-turn-helix domain-containing protein n=1 Tax=Candidatus Chlorohelix allophototropha TaxID=3003348 RepID=A0A8T7M7J3_9CHLR|nr:helix-turn-helix domain-containing protein [Chloroflexota bacterium]WJW69925.1 helix-turn-helix domain-containing protein [Chloroflexota bacterium L227-S17]
MPRSNHKNKIFNSNGLSVGLRIKEARRTLQMTQEDLSKDILSKSYVSAVELGKMQPSIKALGLLAERLGLPVSFFLDTNHTVKNKATADLQFARLRFILSNPLTICDESYAIIINDLKREELKDTEKAELLYLEGRFLLSHNQLVAATKCFEESLEFWEKIGETEWVARLLFNQALLFIQQNNWHSSLACLEKARNIGKISSPELRLRILTLLMRVYYLLADKENVQKLLGECLELASNINSVEDLRQYYLQEACNLEECGEINKAVELLEKGHALINSLTTGYAIRSSLYEVSREYLRQGQTEEALTIYQRVIGSIANFMPDPMPLLALNDIARLNFESGNDQKALEVISMANALIPDGRFMHEEGRLFVTAGSIYEKAGDRKQADTFFEQGLNLLEKSSRFTELAEAYYTYGKLLVERGDSNNGMKYLSLAFNTRNKANRYQFLEKYEL